jgi:hypothetical protein
MTRAFSGDPCGWHEKKDRKSGKVRREFKGGWVKLMEGGKVEGRDVWFGVIGGFKFSRDFY